MESFEAKNKIEQIKSKERLRELERSGNYVFHGSSEKIDTFEPRQAQNFNGKEMVDDDKPGVFASSGIEIPIFRSVFSPTNMAEKEGEFTTGMADYGAYVVTSANRNAINAVKNETGYVYVLERKHFQLRNGHEYICYENVSPVAVFESKYTDISEVVESE